MDFDILLCNEIIIYKSLLFVSVFHFTTIFMTQSTDALLTEQNQQKLLWKLLENSFYMNHNFKNIYYLKVTYTM